MSSVFSPRLLESRKRGELGLIGLAYFGSALLNSLASSIPLNFVPEHLSVWLKLLSRSVIIIHVVVGQHFYLLQYICRKHLCGLRQ